MVSVEHESLLLLFRNRPELAPELLRDALGIELPVYTHAKLDSAELTEVVPATYRADLVVLLVDDKPVLGIVIEVQLQRDPRKRFTWPLYAAGLRARLECPTCVLVVTVDESVARWAEAPIELGASNTFIPWVIGPRAIPIVDDVEVAKRDPELVVLSAMAHGEEPETATRIAMAGYEALANRDGDDAGLYLDLIVDALGVAARRAFEDLMGTTKYMFKSELFKENIDAAEAKGRAEGLATGEARSIITILSARGVAVSDEQKARILACTDLTTLDRWLERSVKLTSADELFAD